MAAKSGAPAHPPSARPEPLNPATCDLRGLDYMPRYFRRLRDSDFNAIANDAEYRAGISLHDAAWEQIPAGSLPNDDRVLCMLAGLGRDLGAWQAVREVALHGFIECADGRLYHPFLCEVARVAWEARKAARDRKRNWRASKAKKQQRDGDVPGTEQSQEQGRDVPVPSEAKRSEATALKGSRVASLRDAPELPSSGTTGQAVEPPAPPSRGKPVLIKGAKATAKQPALKVVSQSDDRASNVPDEIVARWEPVAVDLGLGTFAAAALSGNRWVDHVRRIALAQAAASQARGGDGPG